MGFTYMFLTHVIQITLRKKYLYSSEYPGLLDKKVRDSIMEVNPSNLM